MKDLRIDGRWQRVFVLRESDSRVVYIPVKSVHRIDYERLTKAEKDCPRSVDLMEYLRKIKFDNGRNALAQLDSIIQVCSLSNTQTGNRLRKSDEKIMLGIEDTKPAENKQAVETVTHVIKTEQESVKDEVPLQHPDDPNKPVDGIEYQYIHHASNQKRVWGGKGPMPRVISEHIESGGKLSDFAIRPR